jgi:hypothetical protein
MNFWAALGGGFVGTLVLTTILRTSTELRLTRIDLPFLLGTVLTSSRRRAKAIGYTAHFLFGFLFAVGYYLIFLVLGTSGFLLGAALGVVHGLFAATALVNVLLPVVHPRMGSGFSSSRSTAQIEAPGFLMLNYGRATPIVSLIAHAAYGGIVGAFVRYGSR